VGARWIRAENFPSISMNKYIREVEFEFKAAGFRHARRRVILYPGANLIDVPLERL
jgi:hypothetical protein